MNVVHFLFDPANTAWTFQQDLRPSIRVSQLVPASEISFEPFPFSTRISQDSANRKRIPKNYQPRDITTRALVNSFYP